MGRTNALTATRATNVAAIIDVAETLAKAGEEDAPEDPPDLPPLPPDLPPDLPPARRLLLVLPKIAAEEETDALLPGDESEEELRSFLFSSSSAGSSYVFSQ